MVGALEVVIVIGIVWRDWLIPMLLMLLQLELHSQSHHFLLELCVFVILAREFSVELVLLLRHMAKLILLLEQAVEASLQDLVIMLDLAELGLSVLQLLV